MTKKIDWYISVRSKFFLSFFFSCAWMIFSVWVSKQWYQDLSEVVGYFLAASLILFIAIVPGFMNAFVIFSLLIDKRPVRRKFQTYPALTILIAAYNEEKFIGQTITSLDKQQYPGELEVLVLDDGSIDQTASIVEALALSRTWLRCIRMEKNGGKAAALNRGLKIAKHSLIITLDADSSLYGNALRRIVERYLSDPPNTRAVAGTILVSNSRDNWLTKVQEWDYFHGIATIKRIQSLFQGTLVAQGAFSIYERDTLVALGGWPDKVGEDIVLTWAMLEKGYRVGYCEDAVAFTTVPDNMRQFVRQRQRWARGMIEAFKTHPRILFKWRFSSYFIWWDLAFPLIDVAFTFGFIPGLVLALFGKFWIVGPMTLSLLPIALFINSVMYHMEYSMFNRQGLKVRKNHLGFLNYMLLYGLFVQPAAVLGYASELLKLRKTWGTK